MVLGVDPARLDRVEEPDEDVLSVRFMPSLQDTPRLPPYRPVPDGAPPLQALEMPGRVAEVALLDRPDVGPEPPVPEPVRGLESQVAVQRPFARRGAADQELQRLALERGAPGPQEREEEILIDLGEVAYGPEGGFPDRVVPDPVDGLQDLERQRGSMVFAAPISPSRKARSVFSLSRQVRSQSRSLKNR